MDILRTSTESPLNLLKRGPGRHFRDFSAFRARETFARGGLVPNLSLPFFGDFCDISLDFAGLSLFVTLLLFGLYGGSSRKGLGHSLGSE